MSNVNYSNPGSFDPLETVDKRSQAFGAGTVPGSFLAGMMLPERMNDYRNVRDASLQSSLLGNRRAGAELNDFINQQPSKDMRYAMEGMESRNKLALMPGQLRLATIDQEAQLKYAPETAKATHELKLAQALHGLPAEQRANSMNELLGATALLQGIPDTVDPRLALQFLQRSGVNIEGWNPEFIQHIRSLDPNKLKNAFELEKQSRAEQGLNSRNNADNATAERVARINQEGDRNSAAGMSTRYKEDMDRAVRPILAKLARLKVDPNAPKLTVDEWAIYRNYQDRVREATALAGARTQGDIEASTGVVEWLQDQSKTPSVTTTPSPEAGTVETPKPQSSGRVMLPEVGEVEVLMKNQDGSIRFRDPKTGRTGTYKP